MLTFILAIPYTKQRYMANIIKLWLRKDTKEINRKNTKVKATSYYEQLTVLNSIIAAQRMTHSMVPGL